MIHTPVDINTNNMTSLIFVEMAQCSLPFIFRKYYDELMTFSFMDKKKYSEALYNQNLLWLYLNIDYYKHHKTVHRLFLTNGDISF